MLDVKENSKIIEVRFYGGEITPTSVPIKDFATIVTAIEEIILPILNQQKELFKEGELFGIQSIEHESLGIRYLVKKSLPLVLGLLTNLSNALTSNDLSYLPISSHSGIKKIVKFNKQYKTSTEINRVFNNNRKEVLLNIYDNVQFQSSVHFSSTKELYGKLIGINIKDLSGIILLYNENSQTVKLESEEQIIELGKIINQNVKFSGIAHYSALETIKLTSFQAKSFESHSPLGIADVINLLRSDQYKY